MIAPETLAWLRQAAALDGDAYSQVLLHLLERVEALERRPIPGTIELAAPTPEAAPPATDEELCSAYNNAPGHSFGPAVRAVYDLGRQHAPAQPPAAQPAPPAAPAEALAARPLLEKMARLGDCIGQQTVAQVQQLAEQADAWLQDHPPGRPVAVEPRGCPTPGACSCVEPASPAAPGIFPVEYADTDGDGIRILMEPAEETGQVCWVVRNSRYVNPLLEFSTPEAAHAAHQAAQNGPGCAPVVAPAGGLVERVEARAGGDARAAIREVAAWMREKEADYNAVRWLEQEADQ